MYSPRSEAELEELVRFCHPDKLLAATRLPGTLRADALAALYAVDAERYARTVARLCAARDAVAHDLAASPALHTPALRDGMTILAVGDSITDDLQSWAEVLRRALDLVRPGAGIEVVNAGLSGDTTAAAISRSARLPHADLALVLLGTNDARRHGGGDVLLSDAQTARGVRALDRLLRRRCGEVRWITPPPVVDRRVAEHAPFGIAQLGWRRADLRRKARVVAGAAGAIDLWEAFGDPPCETLLCPDGVHPSLRGQRVIAERILADLAAPP